jgi:hypothetical protein
LSFILHYEQLNCELDISANFLGLEAHARHTAAITAATSAASSGDPINMAPLQDKITRAETVLLFNFNTQQTASRNNNAALAAQIAGEILYYVWRVDNSGVEGSIKKSAFIVEKIFGIGERRAKEYWARYKDISHFMAAIRTMERFPGTEKLSLEEYR